MRARNRVIVPVVCFTLGLGPRRLHLGPNNERDGRRLATRDIDELAVNRR